jgi:PST family polysaccharide transporter
VYLLAFNLSTWPISAVLVAVGRVALAGFARLLGDRERMAAACVRAIGIITSATLPLALLLALLAPQLLTFLYGARWIDAVTPLRFLLVLAVARVLVQVAFEYLVADGRPRTPLLILSLWLVVLVPALFLGAELGGIRGVGVAHMVVVVLVTVPVTLRALRVAGVPLGALGREVVRPAVAAAVMAVVVLAVEPLFSGAFATLVVVGGLGLAVYLLVLAPRNPTVHWTRQHLLPMRAASQ